MPLYCDFTCTYRYNTLTAGFCFNCLCGVLYSSVYKIITTKPLAILAGYLSSDMLWAPEVTGDLLASHGQGYFRMLEPINKALEITIIPLTGSVSARCL